MRGSSGISHAKRHQDLHFTRRIFVMVAFCKLVVFGRVYGYIDSLNAWPKGFVKRYEGELLVASMRSAFIDKLLFPAPQPTYGKERTFSEFRDPCSNPPAVAIQSRKKIGVLQKLKGLVLQDQFEWSDLFLTFFLGAVSLVVFPARTPSKSRVLGSFSGFQDGSCAILCPCRLVEYDTCSGNPLGKLGKALLVVMYFAAPWVGRLRFLESLDVLISKEWEALLTVDVNVHIKDDHFLA